MSIYDLSAERARRQAPAPALKHDTSTARKEPIPFDPAKRTRAPSSSVIVDHRFVIRYDKSGPEDDVPSGA